MVVYGTRPEAIKCAPVVRALRDDRRFEVTVAVTGQHGAILDRMNEFFGIDVDVNRMTALGITTSDIVKAVQAQNAQAAAGRVGAAPLTGDTRFQLTITTGASPSCSVNSGEQALSSTHRPYSAAVTWRVMMATSAGIVTVRCGASTGLPSTLNSPVAQ